MYIQKSNRTFDHFTQQIIWTNRDNKSVSNDEALPDKDITVHGVMLRYEQIPFIKRDGNCPVLQHEIDPPYFISVLLIAFINKILIKTKYAI